MFITRTSFSGCTRRGPVRPIGGNVLPGYTEEFVDVPMAPGQRSVYQNLASKLTAELRRAARLAGLLLSA